MLLQVNTPGEQGTDVPVWPHADQGDVEGAGAHQLSPRGLESGRRRVEAAASRRRRIRGRHAHELHAAGRVEEPLPCLVVVTVGVPRRDETLVDEPHAHARPVDLADAGEKGGQKRRRHSATGDGQVDARAALGLVDERAQARQERAADGLIEGVNAREHLEGMDENHVSPPRSRRPGAAARS